MEQEAAGHPKAERTETCAWTFCETSTNTQPIEEAPKMSSKPSVGDVYGKIVNEVIESSRTAFEEDGIDMSALDLLQQEWQHKLSGLKVAGLPWDPKPVASQYPAQNFRQGQPDSAQARAAANLSQIYGPRASAQIAELQAGQRLPQVQPDSHIKQEDKQQVSPYIKQEPTPTLPSLDNYRSPVSQRSPPIKTDQTDGAGDALDDWRAEYARRKETFRQARARNDRLIRNHVKASQQQLEGGGLMEPLDKRPVFSADAILTGQPSLSRPALTRAQGDAPGDDDDDEVDENAINSDLDDPEDAADDIEGEDTTGNVMLCTYDKVQRVKNKWKCTLKDGIMSIDGQDYLFHKGQGEFEW
ncbi:hypothetical protein DV738_g5056, partial [Chaetothyriales sp. CBS 135597]